MADERPAVVEVLLLGRWWAKRKDAPGRPGWETDTTFSAFQRIWCDVTDRERRGFSEFVEARSTALQRAAYLMVGDVSLAQDLVQESLTKTYVAWPRLRDPANAEAYTRRVITTTALTWFRRRSWSSERPSRSVPERPVAAHDDAVATGAALWAALDELPPRQRVALVLRFYDDLTETQTAEAMGTTVGTVKSQVAAALGTLRARLGDDLQELL